MEAFVWITSDLGDRVRVLQASMGRLAGLPLTWWVVLARPSQIVMRLMAPEL